MMNHPTNCPNITLPLLVAYVEVLLPSITKIPIDTGDHTDTINNKHDNAAELLWVVQDKAEMLARRAQLTQNTDDKNNSEASSSHLSTLPALAQQPVLERYELACFWLPTLSEELLQQYIPLLMGYRDLYATHLLIALDSTIDLRAYGFTPFDILSEQPAMLNNATDPMESSKSLTLWQFNLYDYKKLPNWLNADYWANPENWDKHRW
ncbi:DUF6231 family protein [Psychrobacter sp. LV10R520-6]|uniref:DUF6231 family protein n=1 Tax=Psychrobacter sp. LV10R520-6 TaxID=1415574 RepID=UPI0024C96C0F|nr:DUF6231 family protein [Psychrobacter sp. LV10R520-6]SNT69691.1 hypothetical protein SAMN04488491_0790 [Psychrobacter sp. LV10R520-6]